ncbi:UDP-3-O-(3-hydroxymyristoyl)glucosamine N-acyltransferase [Chitinibacter sp. FCG-7]|uniref:UDP-3-O-acylglucosamine N-acyltransferase n=1 Tax=Chitinibacter mangrovi TaxID=3153927 RepID=A0AAU7FB45_9NEIS
MSGKKISLLELAEQFSAVLVGENQLIHDVSSLKSAHVGDICYLANAKLASSLLESSCSAVIVKCADGLPDTKSYLVCNDPALVFARVSNLFHPLPKSNGSIHASAVIAESVVLGQDVEIGPHVVIEESVRIADGVQLKAGVFVGRESIIGAHSIIMPNVVIYSESEIGQNCVIHAGAVIGSDGFGNAWAGDHWERIPQIGRVIIGDCVEIGANTTIDRGALDDTVIESGVRLDNQIQIAHNVKVGRHTAIAACTGIAGSAAIGENCLIGGGVLIGGHLSITDRVTLLAASAVPSSIEESGVYASGVPIVPHNTWLKNMVHLRKLDQLAKRIKYLEKCIEQQIEQGESCDTN